MAGFSISAAPIGSRAESASPESRMGQTRTQEQQLGHAQSDVQPSAVGDSSPNARWNQMNSYRSTADSQAQTMLNDGFALVAQNKPRESMLRTDIVRVAAPNSDRLLFPYRGTEDARLAQCTEANPKAWDDAFNSFPGLKANLSEQDGTKLMQGLVRNELHYFDAKDGLGDRLARASKPDPTETLGYAQITPKGVAEFEKAYPQMRSFLESKGYAGPGHEAKALEDPTCVPMIVAAKLQSLSDFYLHHTDTITGAESITVNARSLAYGYNADVYYNTKDAANPQFHPNPLPGAPSMEKLAGFSKAFPTADERALSQSMHVSHVEEQITTLSRGASY